MMGIGACKAVGLADRPNRGGQPRRMPLAAVVLCGAFLGLSGCTSLGTNINGSFACGTAGLGTCAPATVIDDRALAEITGDASYVPAGPYRPEPQESRPSVVRASADQRVASSGNVVPAGQKVLRIVFPAHVDEGGRYHEVSVVRAVVDNGSWMEASAAHGVPLAGTVNLTVSPDALAQMDREQAAVETVDGLAVADPDMPSPAAVAAARARGAAQTAAPAAPAEQKVAQVSGPINRPASFNPKVED